MPKRRNRPKAVGGPTAEQAPAPGPAAPESVPVVPADDGVAVAELLMDPRRTRPVVVATIAAGAGEPYADVGQLRSELAGLADVVVLATGAQTWALAKRLPLGTEVYGGAARTYPPGSDWHQELTRAPLRFAFGTYDRERVTEVVLSDAMSAAYAGGLSLQAAGPQSTDEVGTVLGTAGGRALVQLEPRRPMPATIVPELTAPDLLAEQLFSAGMPVRGTYHPEQHRLDVAGMARPPAEALASYVQGSVVLARVRHVERELCVVEVFPDVQASLDVASLLDGEAVADLSTVLSVGEVVRVTIEDWQDDEPVLSLAPETAEPLPAPSVLEGGPPWLLPPAVTPPEVEPTAPSEPQEAEPVAPRAGEDPSVAALQGERDQLLLELGRSNQKLETAKRLLSNSRTEVRRYRERASEAGRSLRDAERRLTERSLVSEQPLFADPERQLRFDVEVTWAHRTTPAEKADLPLPKWQVGDHFFASWDAVAGISREKVVEVVVEVLTGRAERSGARDLHQLRTGSGGDDPPVARPDGATCWRIALQQGTPAARRLHYWRLNDGSYELSSIRLHDDMTP